VSFDVSIGGLVDATGSVSGDTSRDVFRVVTVTVELPTAVGTRSFEIEALVSDL